MSFCVDLRTLHCLANALLKCGMAALEMAQLLRTHWVYVASRGVGTDAKAGTDNTSSLGWQDFVQVRCGWVCVLLADEMGRNMINCMTTNAHTSFHLPPPLD